MRRKHADCKCGRFLLAFFRLESRFQTSNNTVIATQHVQVDYEPLVFNLCEETSTCNFHIETDEAHLLLESVEAVSSWNESEIILDAYGSNGTLLMQCVYRCLCSLKNVFLRDTKPPNASNIRHYRSAGQWVNVSVTIGGVNREEILGPNNTINYSRVAVGGKVKSS